MGSFADVSKALTNPQARTHYLGERQLVGANLPMVKETRCVFLLSLSNQGAGGDGSHEDFRKCFLDYLFTPAAKARQRDEKSQRLFDTLVKDYASMPHGPGETFFTDSNRGIMIFYLKYLHYVLFGIDPDDAEAQKVLNIINPVTGQFSLARYVMPFGYGFGWEPSVEKVGALYMNSPAFANFRENNPAHRMMTKRELAGLCVAIIRIAALGGAPLLTTTVMGGVGLANFTGTDTGDFDVVKVWDDMDLDDSGAIERYIYEVARLANPVTVSHRVATEDFSCMIKGKSIKFPKGTKIAIPLCMASVDEKQWGPTARQFDMSREGLLENVMIFNSVGGRHAGRECPAKELVMDTVTEILQRVGKQRRAACTILGKDGPEE